MRAFKLLSAILLPLVAFAGTERAAVPLRALIVGGGPDKRHNQVAIESNVRYVARVLPSGSAYRVLFADGDWDSPSVQCQHDATKHDFDNIYYRKPQLPRMDGPLLKYNVDSEMASLNNSLAHNPGTPVLLYFTGHGSPDRSGQFANNQFDLWNSQAYKVRDLASALKRFSSDTPVTVVMVECFSGAFANCLFEDGVENQTPIGKNVCGFFASVPQRMAAGCTPAVNEENYKDFTGYFFAALAGKDRMGRAVADADYNHDGRVGMNEAFAYCLFHDDSIDTPMCTSDAFLRHYVKTSDDEVFRTRYDQLFEWAAPEQKAALDGLSSLLGYSSPNRLQSAYEAFQRCNFAAFDIPTVRLIRFVRLAKSVYLSHAIMGVSDEDLKSRYTGLLKAESGNPLRPE